MGIAPATIELYEEHASALIGYAVILVGHSDAEDLVADAMVRVFRTVDLGTVTSPKAYLMRSVYNQAVDRSRKLELGRVREPVAAGRPVIEEAATLDELGVFAHLSVRERAVVFLAYWEDKKPAEIAHMLDLGEGTVRRYLARARKKLRKELQ